MGVSEKWEIAGVLPEDFEEFGEWVFQKAYQSSPIRGGIVYHIHVNTLYMVGQDHRCRRCGNIVPAGVMFRAKTSRLDDIGVE